MSDALTIIRDRIGKAEARMARQEKALESLRSELADLHTAERVLAAIEGDSAPASRLPPGSTTNRQHDIFHLLFEGKERAQAPTAVFAAYSLITSEDINVDTFRTTIWRMKDRVFQTPQGPYVVRSEDGKYWKEPRDVSAARNETEASTADAADAPESGWGAPPPSPHVATPDSWPGA